MSKKAEKYNFEKLEVWQLSLEFIQETYKVTSGFPKNENFGLTSQLKRAAVSISANIAEGAGRRYRKDFMRYLRIALGSTFECVTHLFIAKNQGFLCAQDFNVLYSKSVRISKMINKLIDYLNNKKEFTKDEVRSSNYGG